MSIIDKMYLVDSSFPGKDKAVEIMAAADRIQRHDII